jgi:hypothetical protein
MTKIRFVKLSHIVFIPSEKVGEFNLIHRKGEPIIKFSIFRGEYQSKFVRYDKDYYNYTYHWIGKCEDFFSKEEVIERGLAPVEAFDSDGYIWEPWKVVLHFLDGSTKTKTFWNEAEAKTFYDSFKTALPNEI